jgi:aspartate aminotransferase
MAGFYRSAPGPSNPGRTQMRIAYVEPPELMKLVPGLFVELLKRFLERRPAVRRPARAGTAIRS